MLFIYSRVDGRRDVAPIAALCRLIVVGSINHGTWTHGGFLSCVLLVLNPQIIFLVQYTGRVPIFLFYFIILILSQVVYILLF